MPGLCKNVRLGTSVFKYRGKHLVIKLDLYILTAIEGEGVRDSGDWLAPELQALHLWISVPSGGAEQLLTTMGRKK